MSCSFKVVQPNGLTPSSVSAHAYSFANLHKLRFPSDHASKYFRFDLLVKYYEVLISTSKVVVIATDDATSEVVGFAVAGDNFKAGVGDFVKQYRVMLMLNILFVPRILLIKIRDYALLFNSRKFTSQAPFRIISIISYVPGLHIGSGLVGGIVAFAASESISLVGLSVKPTNWRAIGFYKKYGFELEGICGGSCYFVKKV